MLSSVLSLAAAALVAITPALGRISSVHFPSTAYLGETIQINATVLSYIQNWSDMGIMFGLASRSVHCGTCVGAGYYYYDLYNATGFGTNGYKPGNHTLDYPVPTNLVAGDSYNIVAAVPYVVGAEGTTGIRYWNSSITLTPNPNDA